MRLDALQKHNWRHDDAVVNAQQLACAYATVYLISKISLYLAGYVRAWQKKRVNISLFFCVF